MSTTRCISKTKSVITVKNSNKEILRNGIVVVDFYASWCVPCKEIAPVFHRFAEDYEGEGVTFVKIDGDKEECISDMYKISAFPTFCILNNGKLVKKVTGIAANEIEPLIQKAVKLAKKTA